MNIEQFENRYRGQSKLIGPIVDGWVSERKVDAFLQSTIMAGVLLGDLLAGDGLGDRVSPEVNAAFTALMGDKADNYSDLRALLIDKVQRGDESVGGLLNKIQGQLGENVFAENVGSAATLAESSNQIGWDVQINHGDHTQFVQVKVYEDANHVLDKMQEVNAQIAAGKIEGVTRVDFALNSELVNEVRDKAESMGLPNEVISIGASRQELRSLLQQNFENISDYSAIENFFSNLLGATLTTTALHAAINGFFVWKGAKETNDALEDTVYNSVSSASGLAAGFAMNEALTFLSTPFVDPFSMVTSLGVRSIASRVFERRFVVRRMRDQIQRLALLSARVEAF